MDEQEPGDIWRSVGDLEGADFTSNDDGRGLGIGLLEEEFDLPGEGFEEQDGFAVWRPDRGEIEASVQAPPIPPMERIARVLLGMAGIAAGRGAAGCTFETDLVAAFRDVGDGHHVNWGDLVVVRRMTAMEMSTDIIAIFESGCVARRMGNAAPGDMLTGILCWGARRVEQGGNVTDLFSPPQLLDLLLKPTTQLLDRMRFTSRSKGPVPVKQWGDVTFLQAVLSPGCMVWPWEVGFVPEATWRGIGCVRFGELIPVHFQRRNNESSRFIFKLYNALRLTEDNPNLFCVVGIRWVSDHVISLDKRVFGQLLGLSPVSVEGALLNAQGNFSTHGFVEVTGVEALRHLGVPDEHLTWKREIRDSNRFLVHAKAQIRRSMRVEDVESSCIRWRKGNASREEACATYGLAWL